MKGEKKIEITDGKKYIALSATFAERAKQKKQFVLPSIK